MDGAGVKVVKSIRGHFKICWVTALNCHSKCGGAYILL
jgi:hypothetical protein